MEIRPAVLDKEIKIAKRDASEIPAGIYVRNDPFEPTGRANRNSHFLSEVSEADARKFSFRRSVSPDFLVWLEDVQVRGERVLIFNPDGVLKHSTLRVDWLDNASVDRPTEFQKTAPTMKFVNNRRHGNYYHWTLQCVSAALDMKEQGFELTNLIIPPLNSWRREALELIGYDTESSYEIDPDKNVQCDNLLYSVYSSDAFCSSPSKRLISLFEEFSRTIAKESSTDELPKKIYISREGATRRCIENEREIIECVEKYGFRALKTEEFSVKEQIEIFANAEHVIAPHGGGLVNLLYSLNCVSVTELFQEHYINPCMFYICNAKGIDHTSITTSITHDKGRHHSRTSMDMDAFETYIASRF